MITAGRRIPQASHEPAYIRPTYSDHFIAVFYLNNKPVRRNTSKAREILLTLMRFGQHLLKQVTC